MKPLLLGLIVLAVLQFAWREMRAERTPDAQVRWAKFYHDHPELADCSEEGFDPEWLPQLDQRRPYRGHRHG